MRLGDTYLENGSTQFMVWAPLAQTVDVHIVAPQEMLLPLRRDEDGYHSGVFDGVGFGSRYFYRLDGASEYPDPACRSQPDGVHGPFATVVSGFRWDDSSWCGLPLSRYVIYEVHVGAFTAQGTFKAVIYQSEYRRTLDCKGTAMAFHWSWGSG